MSGPITIGERFVKRTKILATVLLGLGLAAAGGNVSAMPGQGAPAQQANEAALTGTVVESFEAGGYTYAQIDTGSEKVWAAGPVTALEPGTEVRISTGMPMRNFHSKGLNRDFELIYFIGTFGTVEEEYKDVMAATHGQEPKAEAASVAGIAKLDGGQTIAEVMENREAFAGKPVRIRGKVVKYSPAIMGKNWIHLQDSSGSYDLTVTTTDSAKADEVVVVEGTLTLDKDFGFGYVYDTIVEDAKVSRE